MNVCLDRTLTFLDDTAGAQPDGLCDTRAALRKGTLRAYFAKRVGCLICLSSTPPLPPAGLSGSTTPRSLSGTDALQFPGAAVTQKRLRGHRRGGSQPLHPRQPTDPGHLRQCSNKRAEKVAPQSANFFFLSLSLSRLRGCCAIRRWGVGSSCVQERGEEKEHHCQAAPSTLSLSAQITLKTRLQRVHVGAAASVRQLSGSGIVRPGQLSSEMGRRRGREGQFEERTLRFHR